MGFGVGELTYPLDRMPGWNKNGIGYHADDGRLYHTYDHSDANPLLKLSSSLGEAFGPTSTAGDIMGCGVDFDSDVGYGYVNIFFTRNGQLVGSLMHYVPFMASIHYWGLAALEKRFATLGTAGEFHGPSLYPWVLI